MNPLHPTAAPAHPTYAIAEKTLNRWARERLRSRSAASGGTVYCFTMDGSTCSNMGVPLVVEMIVELDPAGRVRAAFLQPAATDTGTSSMCAAAADPARFFAEVAACEDVLGLTLFDAAFRDWSIEVSGCLCTAGNRRHKWRNAFQTIHYAQSHSLSAHSHESAPQ